MQIPWQQSLSWWHSKPPAVLHAPPQQVCWLEQVPAQTPLEQLSHGPQAALAQQNPLTQFPLWHAPDRVQTPPLASRGRHWPSLVQ
jgi:hypothetical protein